MDAQRSNRAGRLRPAWWGVFVCVVAAAIGYGLRLTETSSLAARWEREQARHEQAIRNTVMERFQQRVAELIRVAERVAGDTMLERRLATQTVSDAVDAFSALERYRTRDDVSIDIIDPNGNVVVWSGRNIIQGRRWDIRHEQPDTVVLLSHSDLHTYLSVILPFPKRFFLVVASRPLEVNYPISNRFVASTSFTGELARELGRELSLITRADPASTDGAMQIPFIAPHGDTLAVAMTALPEREAALLALQSQYDFWIAVLLAVAAFLVGLIGYRVSSELEQPWKAASLSVVSVWFVRVSWLFFDFPSSFGGTLFDPVHFASTFGFGLVSSLGETLLSGMALFLSTIALQRAFVRRPIVPEQVATTNALTRFLVAPLVLVFLLIAVLLLTRSYGEALRSIVFDSTIQFHNPTTLLPSGLVAVTHIIIALLSITFLLLLSLLVSFVVRLVHRIGGRVLSWPVASALLLIGVLALRPVVDGFFSHPRFPPLYPIVAVGLGLVIAYRLLAPSENTAGRTRVSISTIAWMLLAAFVVSSPLLDEKIHQKDRDHLQLLANELLRPADAWLSFVLTDALRKTSTLVDEVSPPTPIGTERRSDQAFRVWSQTLLGREGYNSAVVLYDADGIERSRFAVGMTSYEQTELLTAIFEGEEEVLQVLERRIPGGTIKYYGIWGALRDTENRPVGIAALMIAASQQALFRGEAPEPLRASTREPFDTHVREWSVAEYHSGVLVTTNNDKLYRGLPLADDVREAIADGVLRSVWKDEVLNGQAYETLYLPDESRPGVIAAFMVEKQDVRWHVFYLVKILMVYLGVLLVYVVIHLAQGWRRREETGLGFRERLILAFLMLAVIPLVLIGYYNRQLATERLEESVNQRLRDDLTLIEQRLAQTLLEEDDLIYGVSDDFCETVASEFRVDFTVYRHSVLHASSRPELYRTAILDTRLAGDAYAHVFLLGRSYYRSTERVGEVEYAVGYKPFAIDGRTVGVISVPALYRQREVDLELARLNAYIVGVYALVLVLIMVAGLFIAYRLSRPLRTLTQAAREVGRGNLDVQLAPTSSDEVGELMTSFNDMVKELRTSREQIARIEREQAWKEMAKQVAHEIKNPLTPMKLSVQHLRQAFRDNVPNLEEIVARVTQTVIEQVDVLSRIASEFSNFARMPEPRFERVLVHELLRETISLFREVQGIEFQTNFGNTHPVVVADPDELRRVFINLVRNSVQAMDRGGRITLTTAVEDGFCRVSIVDTGYGIPPHLKERVFQPNFSTKTDGTGLGLAICRRIIEDLNGTIELDSEVGKGTSVVIRLPVQKHSETKSS